MPSILSLRQSIQLADYLKSQNGELKGLNASQIATKSSTDLGFVVSKANLRHVSKEIGILLPKQRRQLKATPGNVNKLLAKAILKIADELGIAIDENVKRLANGIRLDTQSE